MWMSRLRSPLGGSSRGSGPEPPLRTWSERSNEGRDYLGLKLDDPSFTAPIYANLFADEQGEGTASSGSRPNRRNGE